MPFNVSCQDNDSYAFRDYPPLTAFQRVHQALTPDMSGASRIGIRRCEACGELTSKWDEPLLNLVIKKRKCDISITYDGVLIVSERLISVYEASDLFGLVFRRLPHDPELFAVHASRGVEFDADRRGTRFLRPCSQCGQYESVVGATPVYLKRNEIGQREFVRTNLEFGSGDEKHPLLLCGDSAARTLEAANLKGLDLTAIESE